METVPLWLRYRREAVRRLRMEVDMLEKDAKGLLILARQNALTDGDWFDLLEERHILFQPYLRDMTLKSLGDLEIIHDQRGGRASTRSLRMGAMVERSYLNPPYHKYRTAAELTNVEGNFPLDTRGIFPDDEVYYHGHFKLENVFEDGRTILASGLVTRFWGLTRNNKWIKAESTERYFYQAYHSGHDERSERRSEVVKFIVSASTPREICSFCNITPQWMWQRLGDVVKEWVTHRERLLSNVRQLDEIVRCEEAILSIIPR